jgi:hypothetical protein
MNSKRRSAGPPRQPTAYGVGGKIDNQIVRQTIHGAANLTSSGAGVIAVAIVLDPATIGNTDFSDFSGTYDEFRVTGASIHLISSLPNSTTLANNIAAIAFDNDSSSAPSSFSNVRQYNNSHVFSVVMTHDHGIPRTYTWWRPTAGSETTINWIDVNSTSPGSIQLYVDNLTFSTLYLTYAVELFVEFRGRR